MPDSTRRQVEINARVFERLVTLTTARVAAGRLESAAGWARVAAAFAMTNPHGALRDVRLENAIDEISRLTLTAVPRRPSQRRRVLHVLSDGHLMGGHVRMARRWVESDVRSRPGVVATRYGSEELAETVRGRGGSAQVLDSPSLLQRAAALRSAAADADIVICHTHPDDPVPALAFGGDYSGPPIVMVNHADHVFWLGTGNLSVLMNLREIGAQTAVSARGYPAEAQAVVPTPLPGVGRRQSRPKARDRIALGGDRIVALTLARGVKYREAPWHPGFVQVMRGALADAPGVTVVAVGPERDDPSWSALAHEFPDRVVVPGPCEDPSVYLDAADVYLDSFPFGSVTSMLEAASRGLPILASRMYSGMELLLSSSGPLDDVVLEASDIGDYRRLFARLATDPALRMRAGRAAAAVIRRRHGSTAWGNGLEQIYERAAVAEPVLERRAPTADAQTLEAYAAALMGIEARAPLLWTIKLCREGFDAGDRWGSMLRTGAVRAVQKLTGSGAGAGPSASSYLIPSRGVA